LFDFVLVCILVDVPNKDVDDDPRARPIFLKEALTFGKIEVVENTGMNVSVE
jgi:hypothetical protein